MLLILIILLLNSILAFAVGRKRPELINTVSQIALGIVFLLSLCSIWTIGVGVNTNYLLSQVQQLSFSIDLHFDYLSWVMMCLVSFISLIIHSYSARYLYSDLNQSRFMAQLSLLTFSVMLLVMSGSLLTAFIAWQLIGLSLYLLLNHYHYDILSNRAAKKKFMINRVGDICFLFAVILTFQHYGNTQFSYLFQIQQSFSWVILMLIFIAVMAKSAQFPLHIWLIDSMQAPTPVSALMHAGVINAGGYLLARMSPLYSNETGILILIFMVGLNTAILGHVFLRYADNVKKELAYSTMAQMGFMVMQCGMGCFKSAIFHLISHGFIKSSLFLRSGEMLLTSRTKKSLHPAQLVIALLVAISVLILAYFTMSQVDGARSMNYLMAAFLGITLFELVRFCLLHWQSNKLRAVFIVALTVGVFLYLLIFNRFTNLLHSGVVENMRSSTQMVLGLLILAGVVGGTFLVKYLPAKNTLRLRSRAQQFAVFEGNVEYYMRAYLLNPIRMLGDRLLMFSKDRPKVKASALVMMLVLVLSTFSADVVGANLIHIQPVELGVFILVSASLIITMLMANRASSLRSLFMLLLLSVIWISGLAFAFADKSMLALGVYSVVNAALLLLAFALLSMHQTNKPALQLPIQTNKLPWAHFYLCAFLLLMIGIPGTASFIVELLLLSALLHMSVMIAITIALAMVMLSLVVLHAMQVYFFNPAKISANNILVRLWMHALCILVIGINLYNGLFPDHLLLIINTVT